MQDLPRHLGQHSGGMVICQGQLDACVPLENASMPGRVVVQWDKDDCADMGIVKVDLLGLGMMAVLQDSLALVNGEQLVGSASHAESEVRQYDDLLGLCGLLGLRTSTSYSLSTWPICRRTRRSTTCSARPTPSACSRSSRARRWRRCRG